jgi:hypothetical protein
MRRSPSHGPPPHAPDRWHRYRASDRADRALGSSPQSICSKEITMIRTSTRPALFAAVCCLLLTGCGPAEQKASGAEATPASAGTHDSAQTATAAPDGGTDTMACGLITEQDATAAIGSPAGPGTSGGSPAFSQCNFDEGALIISMKTQAKALYDTARASLQAGRFTDVPGVGDGAFETGGGASPLVTLEFYKGTTLVSILLAPDNGSGKDAIIAVAKIAASRI